MTATWFVPKSRLWRQWNDPHGDRATAELEAATRWSSRHPDAPAVNWVLRCSQGCRRGCAVQVTAPFTRMPRGRPWLTLVALAAPPKWPYILATQEFRCPADHPADPRREPGELREVRCRCPLPTMDGEEPPPHWANPEHPSVWQVHEHASNGLRRRRSEGWLLRLPQAYGIACVGCGRASEHMLPCGEILVSSAASQAGDWVEARRHHGCPVPLAPGSRREFSLFVR